MFLDFVKQKSGKICTRFLFEFDTENILLKIFIHTDKTENLN